MSLIGFRLLDYKSSYKMFILMNERKIKQLINIIT